MYNSYKKKSSASSGRGRAPARPGLPVGSNCVLKTALRAMRVIGCDRETLRWVELNVNYLFRLCCILAGPLGALVLQLLG
jgi:hypothetical protein